MAVSALADTAADVPTVLGSGVCRFRSGRALAPARSLHRADGIPARAGAGGAAVRRNGLESIRPAIPHAGRGIPVKRLDVTPDSDMRRHFLVDKARRGKDPGSM